METIPLNSDTWRSGLTLEAYVDQMGKFQGDMRRRLQTVRLTPEEQAFFTRLETPMHALALTENWCLDALMNLPILAEVVAAAPGIDLRVFLRSQTPVLDRYYADRGIAAIPVFAFMTQEFKEAAVWVERSKPAHARLAAWWSANPDIAELQDKKSRTRDEALRLKQAQDSRRIEMERWYADELQSATVAEFKTLLTHAPHSSA